jgi:hypothetical protein
MQASHCSRIRQHSRGPAFVRRRASAPLRGLQIAGLHEGALLNLDASTLERLHRRAPPTQPLQSTTTSRLRAYTATLPPAIMQLSLATAPSPHELALLDHDQAHELDDGSINVAGFTIGPENAGLLRAHLETTPEGPIV